MVERPVAIDGIYLDRHLGRVVEIQRANIEFGVSAAQQGKILLLRLAYDHGASPVEKKAGVVADPGTDLEHGSIG
jgi:hypothetical protein